MRGYMRGYLRVKLTGAPAAAGASAAAGRWLLAPNPKVNRQVGACTLQPSSAPRSRRQPPAAGGGRRRAWARHACRARRGVGAAWCGHVGAGKLCCLVSKWSGACLMSYVRTHT